MTTAASKPYKVTPSGGFPILLTPFLYKQVEELGWDMRWYDVTKPLPLVRDREDAK